MSVILSGRPDERHFGPAILAGQRAERQLRPVVQNARLAATPVILSGYPPQAA